MTSDLDRTSGDVRWEGLLERETFGELSEEERIELHALAAESEERRQVLAVLGSIATAPPVASPASAEERRLLDAILKRHAHTVRLRRRAVGLAAAAVLLPLAAAAAYLPWTWRASGPERAPGAASSGVVLPVVAPGTPPTHGAAQGRAAPVVAPSASVEAPARHSAGSAAPLTAAELLALAQRARSAGDYGAAIRTYQQLLRIYPRSNEAQLAQLSLAQLHLAQGNAGAALAGFEAYQRSGGALAQEAHYGKIQALRSLGRTAEVTAETRSFLTLYPKSLQAATLRRQLGAHDGAP